MARNSTRTRRIFGGGGGQPTFAAAGSAAYARDLGEPANQATTESLAVGTHYRVFPGPSGLDSWSYHINPTSAAGATSTLAFLYSNLPNPDPETAAHWVDSGITPIDLTATTDSHATVTGKYPAWILAKATIANSGGALWGYVRVPGVEE
jgi:hypothetical protein